METAELRPLSLGELLDRTFTLYRGNFLVFVGIMAIPAALGIPSTYLLLQLDFNMLGNPASPAPPKLAVIWEFFALALAVSFLSALLYAIVAGAVTFAVSEANLGRRATIATAYKTAFAKAWRLLGVAINVVIRLIGISLAVGAVLGTIGAIIMIGITAAASSAFSGNAAMQPAVAVAIVLFVLVLYAGILAAIVYLGLRYAVAIPALMLEDLGVMASIRRSVQLTKGRRGHVFIALLLAWIISLVGLIVFYVPFYIPTLVQLSRNHAVPSWLSMMSSVSAAVGSSITSPVFLIVLVLCYYDTRIRKEAFDLQFMMASLDRSAPAPAPAPGSVPSA